VRVRHPRADIRLSHCLLCFQLGKGRIEPESTESVERADYILVASKQKEGARYPTNKLVS
jgi:hypothetical protein